MDASDAELERQQQRALVRDGYDQISHLYRADDATPNPTTAEHTATYRPWLEELATSLIPAARVLDLGCGAGLPAARWLADAGYQVTGVDISTVQIQRARSLVPNATFIEADMATWDATAGSFDAIVSFYALIHLPLEDQRQLVPRLARWLSPTGYLLAIVGDRRWTGTAEYLGTQMFWDHPDTPTYIAWLEAVGLRVQWQRHIPEGDSGHTLLLARASP